MGKIFITWLLGLFLVLSQAQARDILSVEVDSSINPATLNYLKSAYAEASKKDFMAVLIKLNTPGGLVTTTKDILTMMGKATIPTIVWVTPEGASATSAGAILASAAHVLVMNPGTNIGAATPVQMGKDIESEDLRAKAINDLVALVQSLAQNRGRNAKLFGEMIKKASSFEAQEAKKKNLIDGIVNDEKELLSFLNDKTISLHGRPYELQTEGVRIVEFGMDLGQRLLNIFANPSMAYVLFLVGAALIYLELQAPGGMIAGAIGVICLVLAGIGFQVLPLNFGALGLIVLAFVLFVMEIYITSYGLLALAGIAALVFGSLFLFRTDNAYIELSTTLIGSVVGAIVIFLFFLLFFLARDVKKPKRHAFNDLTGKEAEILEVLPADQTGKKRYRVKVGGEIWVALSETSYETGERTSVLKQDHDHLTVYI